MAADSLRYDSDQVPVGGGQAQHIEVARNIAGRFNATYNTEALHLPEPYEPDVTESIAKVPGIDGNKMSKSYGNTIELFQPDKKIRKRIMSIKTDSAALEDPKDPAGCLVFTLYQLFANQEQQDALADRYRAGGMGYGEAKQSLYEAAMEYFAPARERREQLVANADQVEDILQAGAARAREKAREVLDRVRTACGLAAQSQ